MPEHCLFIQSLYGHAAEGNWHTLIYSEQATPPATLAPELRELPNLIQLGGTPAALWARFYQRSQPVLRCGSANIAIAEAARQLFGVPESGGWALNTRAGTVWLGYDDRGAYYRDRPQRQRPIPDPDLWQRVLTETAGARHNNPERYIAGCYAGDDTDYCLLLLARPLQQVQPDLPRLCDSSRRALILLYCPFWSAPDRAHLRYFAPQYGADEDAATGSASVQAAHFFWQRYGQERMTFMQQSREGGYIQTEIRGDQVWVRGKARISCPSMVCERGFSPADVKAGRGHRR